MNEAADWVRIYMGIWLIAAAVTAGMIASQWYATRRFFGPKGRHRASGRAWAHYGTGEHRPAPGAGTSVIGRVRAALDDRVDTQVDELVGHLRGPDDPAVTRGRGAAAYKRLGATINLRDRLRKVRRGRAAVAAEVAVALSGAQVGVSIWGTPMIDDTWVT